MTNMTQPMTKRRIIFLSVLLFAVSLGITGGLVKLFEDQRFNEKQVAGSTIGNNLSYSLQRRLDRSVSSTYALASLIRQNENHTIDDFDSIAGDMIETYGGIDSLQLAPDGVISQIYPLAGNEKAIGHDLLKDPARRAEALAAIESKDLTLAGPFTLIQGGVAVIGRLPVFIPDDAGGDRFWGFTIALIRLPTLLEAINLKEIAEQGYDYELSRLHPDTSERQVFVRSTETDLRNALAFAIETPNGAWTLDLAPQGGWRPLWLVVVEVLMGTLISTLLATLFYYCLLRIAEREKTEQALQKAHNDLEIRVKERTAELAKTNANLNQEIAERRKLGEELLQTRDTALEASRAKSEFLSSMSHEIRTPMNTIIGMGEALQQTQLTSKQQEYVRISRRAGETLLDLINDILDLSKVEAGQIEIEEVEFDLVQLVEDTTELFAVRAREKSLELNCHVTSGVPTTVVGDPIRLRQVISNLVSNAVKFTKKGLVVVQVENDPSATEVGAVLFRVTDTGIGIPPEKLDSIFESFTQADSSTTREYGGTGLGLTISKRLVALMGGHMWVESEVGHGSTFYFTAQFRIQAKENEQRRPSCAELRGLKALIVDDNPGLCLFVKEVFAEWGVSAVPVENGYQALAELDRAAREDEPYQLMLLDRCLPDMDGFEVAAHIQKDAGIEDLSIIMITAFADVTGDIALKQASNISCCLIKPFKQLELLQAVATTLGFMGAAEELPQGKELNTPKDQRPLRILLVDDYEDNRFVIQSHLKETPYLIDIAEKGS